MEPFPSRVRRFDSQSPLVASEVQLFKENHQNLGRKSPKSKHSRSFEASDLETCKEDEIDVDVQAVATNDSMPQRGRHTTDAIFTTSVSLRTS